MQFHSILRQGGLSRAAVLWLLVAIAVIGLGAYFFYPWQGPTAPRLMAPPDGASFDYTPGGNAVVFGWKQGGVAGAGNRQPAAASRMVICIYENTQPASCGGDGGNSGLLRIDQQAGAFHRDPVEADTFMERVRRAMDPAFEYRHQMSFVESGGPRHLRWTVGACAGPDDAACTFAAPGRAFSISGSGAASP